MGVVASASDRKKLLSPHSRTIHSHEEADCTWNSLPNKIVDAESVNTFSLDKYWKDQPLLYDFKAELAGTGDRSKRDIEV